MSRILFYAVLTACASIPMAAAAQDENVNCQQWFEMDSVAQLDAIDFALDMSEEHGMGRRFGEDATDEEKLDYMQHECSDPEGSVMVDLIDMLGT